MSTVTHVAGHLTITADNAAQYAALTSVGGGLYVEGDASLPALTSVGGGLSVRADASLPALTSVGGGLSVYADASLPALTSVGGGLYVYADASLHAPLLGWVEVARSHYALLHKDGLYRAGCRGPFTAEQALTHWRREDERAQVFTAAILANEGRV